MAFTYGFYNALNNDRMYDALQMSEIFDGIINDGVYATIGNHYIVKQNLVKGEIEPNTVIVGSGRAWFDHTWNKNDVDTVYEGPAAEKAANRYDAIVIDVNRTDRTNQILWVTGNPAANPVKPALVSTTEHHQYPLCYIYRPAGINQIEQSNIENRVGQGDCPFVTGIIETINLDQLMLQWSAEWTNKKTEVNAEWEGIKASNANEWTNIKNTVDTEWTDIKNEQSAEWSTIKTELSEEQQEIVAALTQWVQTNETTFENWFGGIVNQMTSDVATALQLQLNRTAGLTSKHTVFSADGTGITETYYDGSRVDITFEESGNVVEKHYNTDGTTLLLTKTIIFEEDGSITEDVVYATPAS